MDSFIEYMIAQKKTAKTVLKKTGIYMAAFMISMLFVLIILIFGSALISLIPMVMLLIFYVAYRINTSFDVEFEYILTNGELDIDKITHKRRRKRLMTVHCKSFIAFAKVIDASAKSSSITDYYAVFFKNGQKTKLIFNPTQKMIDIFKVYAPRVVK